MTYQKRQSVYSPKPEEIERKCEEIRSQWDEREQEVRAGPVVKVSEFPVQLEDET